MRGPTNNPNVSIYPLFYKDGAQILLQPYPDK